MTGEKVMRGAAYATIGSVEPGQCFPTRNDVILRRMKHRHRLLIASARLLGLLPLLVARVLTAQEIVRDGAMEKLVLLLSPFAPHLSEELWDRLGQRPSAGQQPWPQFDPALVVSDRLKLEVHTHFTGTPSERHVFAIEDFTRPDVQQRLLEQGVIVRPVANYAMPEYLRRAAPPLPLPFAGRG